MIVGSATDGADGLQQICRLEHSPEIVLLDAGALNAYEFA